MRRLDGVTDSMDMSLSELRERAEHRVVWCAVVHGVAESPTERLSKRSLMSTGFWSGCTLHTTGQRGGAQTEVTDRDRAAGVCSPRGGPQGREARENEGAQDGTARHMWDAAS